MSELDNIKSSLKRITAPLIRERLLMVQATYKGSLREVAKTFGCTHGKVDYWRKRYDKMGLKGLETKPRSGRPPFITKQQAKDIRKVVRKHNVKRGWKTTHIRNTIYETAGIKYSTRQIIRISQSWGLSKIKPRPRYAFSKEEERVDFLKKTAAI